MFVKRQQAAEQRWGHAFEGYHRGGVIARLRAVWAGVATHRQRLGLGQRAGLVHRVEFGVAGGQIGRHQEFGGEGFAALVEQLHEGVLGVGTGAAEEHRAGAVADGPAIAGRGLAQALHEQLLQVVGQAGQALGVRQHDQAVAVLEVDVPDVDQCGQHGQVLVERRSAEMSVHGARAF